MLQHFAQKFSGFLPFFADTKTPADYLEEYEASLTAPSGYIVRRALSIYFSTGVIETSLYSDADKWQGTTMDELRQMMNERHWTASDYELDEFELQMRYGRPTNLHLVSSSDTTEYPVYRLTKKQALLARKAGVKRKYPSWYDESIEPAEKDSVIDGVLYASDTLSRDFVCLND